MPTVDVTVPNASGVPEGQVSSWQQLAADPKNGTVSNTPITKPSPVMNSSASRSQTTANTQIYNTKVDALAAKTGTGMQTTDPVTGKPIEKTTGAAAETPPTVYVDANFAATHDMNNPAFKGYVVGTPDGNKPAATKSDSTDPNAAIDAKYQQQGADYTANAQKQLDLAKTEMDAWKTNNDAIADSLIEGIKATFEASIATMTEMNRQATARDTATGYEGGGGAARYAPQLNDSVISDTVQKGIMRINDLKAAELQAIAKAQQAKNNDDYAAFNKYMDKVTESQKSVTDELTRLADQANKDKNALIQQAQEQRAQQKAVADAANNLAKQYAPSAAAALAALPTAAAKKKYLEELAKTKGLDPMVLQSEIDAYSTKSAKDALDTKNTESEIKTREMNAETSRINANKAAKPTADEKKGEAWSRLDSMLTPEAQAKAQKMYGVSFVDKEGYITPEGLQALLENGRESGVTRQEVLSTYADRIYVEKGKASTYGLTQKEVNSLASSNSEDKSSVIDRSMVESSFGNLDADETMSRVDAYRASGLSDKEIIKLLTSANDKAA